MLESKRLMAAGIPAGCNAIGCKGGYKIPAPTQRRRRRRLGASPLCPGMQETSVAMVTTLWSSLTPREEHQVQLISVRGVEEQR